MAPVRRLIDRDDGEGQERAVRRDGDLGDTDLLVKVLGDEAAVLSAGSERGQRQRGDDQEGVDGVLVSRHDGAPE